MKYCHELSTRPIHEDTTKKHMPLQAQQDTAGLCAHYMPGRAESDPKLGLMLPLQIQLKRGVFSNEFDVPVFTYIQIFLIKPFNSILRIRPYSINLSKGNYFRSLHIQHTLNIECLFSICWLYFEHLKVP